MSILLLLSPSVPPPEPVTVLGSATPSSLFSDGPSMWTTGSWDGSTYEVCLSELADVEVGDFCVLVIHFHASPSYVGVSLALSRNKWTTHVVHTPNNPDSPYDGIGTIVASRVYAGNADDCFRVALPTATNAIARVFSYSSALRMSAIGPILQSHQYGNNPFPGDALHLGLSHFPRLASCVYTSAADCGGGNAYASLELSDEGFFDYDAGGVGSRPVAALSGTHLIGATDEVAPDAYTVFPFATKSKSITVVPFVALDEGIPVSAEIVSPSLGNLFTASAVIRNSLVSRFAETYAEAEIVGVRESNGTYDTVYLTMSADAEISVDTVRLGLIGVSAEIEPMSLSASQLKHPRNSDFHTHTTFTSQIFTTVPVLDMPSGSVLHDVLQAMWDEQARMSSLNRWPLSFTASAEVV